MAHMRLFASYVTIRWWVGKPGSPDAVQPDSAWIRDLSGKDATDAEPSPTQTKFWLADEGLQAAH